LQASGYIKLHQVTSIPIESPWFPGEFGAHWCSPWLLVEHFGNLTTVFGGKDPGDQLVEADATVAVPEEVSK